LSLSLAKRYAISIIVTEYNGEPVFPFEMKTLGYDSERIAKTMSKIEGKLLLLIVKNRILNEAVSYLFDSHSRLEENDTEGARTSLRNAIDIIRKKFIKNIRIENLEENRKFLKNLRRLTSILSEFFSYGGPHPGPAPRMTTEMIIGIVIDIMEYFLNYAEAHTSVFSTP
jgi:hypothetical protein